MGCPSGPMCPGMSQGSFSLADIPGPSGPIDTIGGNCCNCYGNESSWYYQSNKSEEQQGKGDCSFPLLAVTGFSCCIGSQFFPNLPGLVVKNGTTWTSQDIPGHPGTHGTTWTSQDILGHMGPFGPGMSAGLKEP